MYAWPVKEHSVKNRNNFHTERNKNGRNKREIVNNKLEHWFMSHLAWELTSVLIIIILATVFFSSLVLDSFHLLWLRNGFTCCQPSINMKHIQLCVDIGEWKPPHNCKLLKEKERFMLLPLSIEVKQTANMRKIHTKNGWHNTGLYTRKINLYEKRNEESNENALPLAIGQMLMVY